MFGMGGMEVLVVLVLALVILGPDRLIGVARTLGKSLRELRQTTEEVTRSLTMEEEPPKPDRNQDQPAPSSPEGSQPRSTDEGQRPPAPPSPG